MTPVVLLAALSMLLLGLVLRPRRTASDTQREVARRAHLDTYTPQSVDREWSQWARHHGGGL
jgi:hypothetical protein